MIAGSGAVSFLFLCIGATAIASTGNMQRAAVEQVPSSS